MHCLDGEWSKEATDEFDQLTHCAQWVSVMARVLKYDGDIPCVELIDTTGQTVRSYEHVQGNILIFCVYNLFSCAYICFLSIDNIPGHLTFTLVLVCLSLIICSLQSDPTILIAWLVESQLLCDGIHCSDSKCKLLNADPCICFSIIFI